MANEFTAGSVIETPFSLYYRCSPSGGGTKLNYSLFCDNLSSLTFSYKHYWSYPFKDTVEKQGGTPERLLSIINTISSANSILLQKASSSPQLISVYQEVPAYKDTEPLSVPNSLTFSFNFGQYGNFSGRDDVVIPILWIAKIFAPSIDTGGLVNDYPLPVSSDMIAGLLSSAFGGKDETGNLAIDATGSLSDELASRKAEEVDEDETEEERFAKQQAKEQQELSESMAKENVVFQRVSQIVKSVDTMIGGNNAYANRSGLCRFTVGGLISPVFSVGEISFGFDFTEMDNEDFPMSGTLSLGKLETLSLATDDLMTGL